MADNDTLIYFTGPKASNNNFAVDQVEISWLFDFDPVTAQIDVSYLDGADGGTTMGFDDYIEQAFVNYELGDGGVITAGRFYSMLSFEAFKAPGLYQYSTAYESEAFGQVSFLPDGGQGVKYTYNDDSVFFGVSLLDSTFGFDRDRLGGSGSSSWAVEVDGALAMDEGLTFFLGGAYEDADASFFQEYDDAWVINTYVTFETGAWIFAGELNYFRGDVDGGGNDKGWSGLLMGNFAYSEEASVTGRYSYLRADPDGAGGKPAFHKFTLAHNYAFTDNLGLVTEYSHIRGNSDSGKYREHLAAVELLFTF